MIFFTHLMSENPIVIWKWANCASTGNNTALFVWFIKIQRKYCKTYSSINTGKKLNMFFWMRKETKELIFVAVSADKHPQGHTRRLVMNEELILALTYIWWLAGSKWPQHKTAHVDLQGLGCYNGMAGRKRAHWSKNSANIHLDTG